MQVTLWYNVSRSFEVKPLKNDFNTKYDFKNAFTEQKIKDALLLLNSKDEISEITVGDICREVKISRSTFYRHFSDIYAVIESIEEDVTAEFRELLLAIKDVPAENEAVIRRKTLRYFHNCRFRRTELLTLLDSGKYPASYKRFRKMVYETLLVSYNSYRKSDDPKYYDFLMNYVAGTIIDLIVIWLREDTMNYEEFLSFYVKIFRTDLELLNTVSGI